MTERAGDRYTRPPACYNGCETEPIRGRHEQGEGA